jgi:hypothetical protein
MIRLVCLSLAAVLFTTLHSTAQEPTKESRMYELRIYTATKGKLPNLLARFRDHTVKLFEKHGLTNVGYWVPVQNDDEKLYYIISYKDKASRNESFKNFINDPDWKKASAESVKDGEIVAKIEEIFLTATDYSPPVKPSTGDGERLFELRTYTATKGNLPALNSRFRDHTVKLFEKHGITNLFYFNLAEGSKGADTTLIYLLAHKDEAAMKASFDSFRKDADWVAARKASEEKAGGSLTEAEGGVKSLLLKATDFSMTK